MNDFILKLISQLSSLSTSSAFLHSKVLGLLVCIAAQTENPFRLHSHHDEGCHSLKLHAQQVWRCPPSLLHMVPYLQAYLHSRIAELNSRIPKERSLKKTQYFLRSLHQCYTFFFVYLTWVVETCKVRPNPIPMAALKDGLHRLDVSLLSTGFPFFHNLSTKFLIFLHACLPKQTLPFDSSLLFHPKYKPVLFTSVFPPVHEFYSFPFHLFNNLNIENNRSARTEAGLCPFVLRKAVLHWPACQKWTLEYFMETSGDRLVPIELGQTYADVHWTMKYMTLAEFLRDHIFAEMDPKERGNPLESDKKFTAVAETKSIGYLAQYDLFRQLPFLEKDIGYPDSLFIIDSFTHPLEANDDVFHRLQRHVWLGPANTTTPFHHDGELHNLFTQVKGQKRIVLVPAWYEKEMYPYPIDSNMKNTSQVDFDAWDISKVRQWIEQEHIKGFECLLEEGDLLYIPPGWWHFVKSLTASISVSFWWE